MKKQKTIPENSRLLLLSTGNFIVLYAVYLFGNSRGLTVGGQPLLPWLYLAAGIILFAVFFFLNRGFSFSPTPPENLPAAWSPDKKAAYLHAEAARRRPARYLLTVVIPIIFVFLLDALDLFLLNGVISSLGERMFA